MEQIDKVNKRREVSVLEKQLHEEERELLARECARDEFQDWQKKDEFLFNQNKTRSGITGLVSTKEIGSNFSVMDGRSRMCSDYWKAILEICISKTAEAS
ncbi:unnamed protein product [Dovyalis caffra]|uniref:Uncharacterized protein n=1 Tax=Dovyalis caffra TaxID=77055 RepID=A0AAV1RCF9_9ROSI|nr:unnamed protein product [Dovyalis caffra]